MCNFASFVLTKDGVFWLEGSESHSEIIAKNGLHESGARGVNVLKVEITPTPEIEVWPSLAKWAYRIDQDLFPEWHDTVADEARARQALRARWKEGFTTVYASGCTKLAKLDAPNAQTVDASGCTKLAKKGDPRAL